MAKEKPDLGGEGLEDIERSCIHPCLSHHHLFLYPVSLSSIAKTPGWHDLVESRGLECELEHKGNAHAHCLYYRRAQKKGHQAWAGGMDELHTEERYECGGWERG